MAVRRAPMTAERTIVLCPMNAKLARTACSVESTLFTELCVVVQRNLTLSQAAPPPPYRASSAPVQLT